MTKMNIWLFVAILAAVLVNPDESDLDILLLVWGNLFLAIGAKALQIDNESKKNPYEDEKNTDRSGGSDPRS